MDFGFLPEFSQKSLPIKLLNKGTYQVPIIFILNQVCFKQMVVVMCENYTFLIKIKINNN